MMVSPGFRLRKSVRDREKPNGFHHQSLFYWKFLLGCALCLLPHGAFSSAQAQIGGKTADDGPFVLEDVEDLDLTADGVMRNWVPDQVAGVEQPLVAINPVGAGLTLLPGQSPAGALEFTVPSSAGYVRKGFGVPVPAVAGASTLTDPGNISDFAQMTFAACFEPALPGSKFQVILETYPANTSTNPPTYPHIYWNFTPPAGATFEKMTLDLRAPTLIENAGELTLDELLSQTRFLYFYCYAGPLAMPQTMRFRIDDITLTGLASDVPRVTAVAVHDGLNVDIAFNRSMASEIYTASNYTLSGDGRGALAEHPDSVTHQGGNTYRLAWSTGEMRNLGDITIAVSGVHDAEGNPLGSPASRTHPGGGIGTAPYSQVIGPSDGPFKTTSFTLVWTSADDAGPTQSGVDSVDIFWSKDGGSASTLPGSPFDPATTSAPFDARNYGGGGVYSFYSIATDRAGNVEAATGFDLSVVIQSSGTGKHWILY